MNKVLLLSFPRSANTWIRYCLEHITKTQTCDCQDLPGTPNRIVNPFNANLNYKLKPYIYKEHFAVNCDRFDEQNDKLILILRNYKECLIRHYGVPRLLKNLDHDLKQYTDNILFFDKWKGEKIIIYYEDIINNFEHIIKKIAMFLNLDPASVNEFIKDYDFHKSNGIKSYKICGHESVTKGKVTNFHSKKAPLQLLKRINKILNENNIKYIQRYK